MERKAVNDAVAYLRSLAELRGRNVQFAELAVRDAATLTAAQAHAQGVVEIIAVDADALLRQAHGRSVRLASGEAKLDVAGRTVTVVEPDWRASGRAILDPRAKPAVLTGWIVKLEPDFPGSTRIGRAACTETVETNEGLADSPCDAAPRVF